MGCDRVAIVEDNLRFTYGQVAVAVDQASAEFRSLGVGPGDRVAHLGRLSAAHPILTFACAKLGAVYTPLDAWASWPAIETMLELVDPRILVLDRSPMGRPLVGQVPEAGSLRPGRMAVIDGTVSNWASPATEAVDRYGIESAVADASGRPHVILFTSGTTGVPKPLVYTQAAVSGQGLLMALALHFGPADRFLNVFPAGHFGGIIPAILTLGLGGRLIQVPLPDAGHVFRALENERPTFLVATPQLWRQILNDRRAASSDWSCMRVANISSDTISVEMLRKVMDVTGAISIQGYGLTEAGLVTLLPHAEAQSRLGSAGLVLPFCNVRIVSDNGDAVPEGESGEILVHSPFGACGIWRDGDVVPLEGEEDGWLPTGDLGHLENGYLTVTGRKGTLLKVSGFRIAVAEVERSLQTHPAVADCAVVGTPHPELGEAPVAIVALADGIAVSADELRRWVVRQLQPRAAPVSFCRAESIPRSAGSGKIQRKEVADNWRAGVYPELP